MAIKVDPQIVKKVLEETFGEKVSAENVQKVTDSFQAMFDAIEQRRRLRKSQ